MHIEFDVMRANQYLHATARGEYNFINMNQVIHRTLTKAQQTKIYSILLINELKGPDLSTSQTLKIIFSLDIFDDIQFQRIALVEFHPDHSRSNFLVTLLCSLKGINAKLFSDRNYAQEWLLSESTID